MSANLNGANRISVISLENACSDSPEKLRAQSIPPSSKGRSVCGVSFRPSLKALAADGAALDAPPCVEGGVYAGFVYAGLGGAVVVVGVDGGGAVAAAVAVEAYRMGIEGGGCLTDSEPFAIGKT